MHIKAKAFERRNLAFCVPSSSLKRKFFWKKLMNQIQLGYNRKHGWDVFYCFGLFRSKRSVSRLNRNFKAKVVSIAILKSQLLNILPLLIAQVDDREGNFLALISGLEIASHPHSSFSLSSDDPCHWWRRENLWHFSGRKWQVEDQTGIAYW